MLNLKSLLNILTLAVSFMLLSCGGDNAAEVIESDNYYACDGSIVIHIEQRGSSIFATVFDGKELLIGRDLVRDSVSKEELFHANDISITISGDMIDVKSNNINISNCYVSQSEMERRGKRDTYHYISDNGSLITTKKLSGDRIQFTLKTGQNVILDTILPHVKAASGVKYEEGDIMFWVKQNTAMLVYQGMLYGHCVLMFEEEVKNSACMDTALHTGVVRFLKNELIDDLAFIPENARMYYAERVDINDDGLKEIFVSLSNSYFCGSGGCSWYILNPDFSLFAKFTASDFPVYISNDQTNGYRDLYVVSNGKHHVLKFNNGYPSNPSVEPLYDIFEKSEYTNGGTKRVLEWAYLKSCRF